MLNVEKRNVVLSPPVNWELDIRAKRDLLRSKECLHFICNNNNNNDSIIDNNSSISNNNLNDIISHVFDNIILLNSSFTSSDALNKKDYLSNIFNYELDNDTTQNDNSINKNSLKQYIQVDNYLILWNSSEVITNYCYCLYRLSNITEFGLECPVQYILLVSGPSLVKQSKSCEQVAKSFSYSLKYPLVQYHLNNSKSTEEVVKVFEDFANGSLNIDNSNNKNNNNNNIENSGVIELPLINNQSTNEQETEAGSIKENKPFAIEFKEFLWSLVFGYKYIIQDIQKRYPDYWNDWADGFSSGKAFSKTLSTSVFLFFAVLLPSIAFGVLNQSNTDGKFSVAKTIISQGCGGMVFALLSGQPMVVLLSTAPLAIFIKITYSISSDNNLDFWSLYAMIGLFNGIFLIIYSVLGLSRLMKYSSRFIEETFAVFITIAFLYDGIKPIVELFIDYLYDCGDPGCTQSHIPIFALLLSLTTLWLCFKLSNFGFSQFFNSTVRNVISDYALFIGVILSTFIRYTIFLPLDYEEFPHDLDNLLHTEIHSLPVWSYFLALGLGFLLSLLYFVDQNISSSLATAPSHNLKRWSGMHLDLFLVAIINIVLSFLGLPWVHGALPHSSLHVRALANIQTIFYKDHTKEIFISVQETRASGFISHLLTFICIFLVSNVLKLIPIPVLYGVFWFLGVKALVGNQFWDRILLLITDQNLHPHSTRSRCIKQSHVHLFTLVQIICLLVFCFISFYPNPYLTIFFPLFLTILIPLKNYLFPKLFSKNIINILDHH
ncbi:hypothetical protein DICPUDRAFT_48214 [Dictyostelium purpureum]|uniref:Bicarbonate transporter-like transmembrane domain-containing protein n=1 Tax=Dictyostelium purpureum TaxID=5786 RepID=F0ZNA4_DICPU|nr:uncharacterized protein DICPUDRAFT_48214 [Dictyostelium purpureum]EGC34570.1 hypothetical protein DICPUDRAFT_48214 [Dictyostelium purpureum]|eukprot:XP_003288894.1 hypothetical protein DICPUDRAFT_48214 [Dictyostelium purpureum]